MTPFEALLVLMSLVAVLLNIVSFPGNVVPLVVALGYYFFGESGVVSGRVLLLAVGLFVSGELVEQVSSLFGARLFGASRAGMLGALVGGVIGALLGTAVLPLVGTVLGVFLGCFVFAVVFELLFAGKGLACSLAAGLGALVGKVLALAFKYAVGFALVALLVTRLSQS